MVKKPITVILQARMGSSRLPGKTLKKIQGDTVLHHVVTRIRRAVEIDGLVVATTNRPADDAVEAECKRLGANCFRGDEDDVLARFFYAAKAYEAENIMRICGDNPLIDPELIDSLARFYREGGYTYARHTGTPLGLATEVFSFDELKQAHEKATEPSHREHVTPFIYTCAASRGNLQMQPDLSHLRFTLDTQEDFDFISGVYQRLYPYNKGFTLGDILQTLSLEPAL